jgi:ABC-2 type transport system ATP-binding protein
MTPAISTRALARSYHGRPALRGVDLDVPAGVVFGYLGPNGAGKTTTIRLLAGLMRPTSGRAEVFGMDVVTEREQVQARIGYLPGDFVAYQAMTGEQYLRYLANLRGSVDWGFAQALAKRLDLDLSHRIGALSHGNRQKVGIVQAFMHQPDLLILDEPTGGLDPLMQREFLAMVREARDQGGTVFLSSHVLGEVEAVADTVGILRAGRLVVVEAVPRLKSRALRRVDLTFEGEPPLAELRAVPGVRDATAAGRTVHLAVEGSAADMLLVAAPHRIEQVVTHEPDLEEIFLDYYRANDAGDGARESKDG